MAALVHSWGSPCSRIAFVHFKNVQKPTWIISAYAPTRDADDAIKETYYDALRDLLNTVPRSHLIIIGTDANAQFGADESSPALGRWYYPAEETNDNGERLLTLAEEYDLCLANTTRRTNRSQRVSWCSGARMSAESKIARRSGQLMSLIDYVLISSRWAPMVEKAGCVQRSVFPSDHRPVTMRMKLRYVAPKNARCKRYDMQRLTTDAATKERYQREVLDRLYPPAERRDVLVTAETFTAAVVGARDAHVPELRAEKRKPLISAEAERLVTQLADSRRRKDEQQSVRLKRTLRMQLKRELWQRRTEEIEDAWRCNNSKKVYTLLRRYSGKLKAASDTLAVDGRCVAGDRCLDAWKDHFSALLNRPPPAGEPLEVERLPRYECVEEGPPTSEEVKTAIKQMRSGKAAGEDGVQPELLKALPDMAVAALTSVYKSIWDYETIPDQWRTAVVIPLHKKGSVTNPANYRGISLLDLQYKLLERIIANRIVPARDARTRDEQAGFRPGRSTIDQVFVLRRVMETHHRYNKPVEVAFLDYACAFDSPDRERIYQLLESDGVPKKLVRIIREMNTGSQAVVRTRSGCSQPFPVATSVKQGSVLGPLLFNYVIDAIMRASAKDFNGGVQLIPSAKVLTDLDYADDIALLSTCREELQMFIDRVAENAARFGLRLKPVKCELLSACPGEANPITVNGEAIKKVKSFCYLGSIITADGSVKEDIAQRIRKARTAFTTLSQCLWRTNVSHRMKLRVYATAIRPILLYASETWPLTQCEQERLNRAERSFIRQALGIRPADKVSNWELWTK
ncbi:endonuclease-reverse transcriptase, partial [Aphelenchoides avenae]